MLEKELKNCRILPEDVRIQKGLKQNPTSVSTRG